MFSSNESPSDQSRDGCADLLLGLSEQGEGTGANTPTRKRGKGGEFHHELINEKAVAHLQAGGVASLVPWCKAT